MLYNPIIKPWLTIFFVFPSHCELWVLFRNWIEFCVWWRTLFYTLAQALVIGNPIGISRQWVLYRYFSLNSDSYKEYYVVFQLISGFSGLRSYPTKLRHIQVTGESSLERYRQVVLRIACLVDALTLLLSTIFG